MNWVNSNNHMGLYMHKLLADFRKLHIGFSTFMSCSFNLTQRSKNTQTFWNSKTRNNSNQKKQSSAQLNLSCLSHSVGETLWDRMNKAEEYWLLIANTSLKQVEFCPAWHWQQFHSFYLNLMYMDNIQLKHGSFTKLKKWVT